VTAKKGRANNGPASGFECFIERQRQRRQSCGKENDDSYDSPAIAVVSIPLRFMLWKGAVA